MIFAPLRVGGPNSVLAPVSTVFFAFPADVQSAHAVLQSFSVRTDSDDIDVENVQVSLETFFDPAQSPTSGMVEVRIQLTGSPGGFTFISSRSVVAEVRLLVIGN